MRPDIANAVSAVARQARDPAERHRRAVRKDSDLKFSVYVDADYADKDNDRCSVSGVAVMVGGTVVNASSTTQQCVTLCTSEEEYVAMAQGGENRAIHEGRVGFHAVKAC